MNTSGGGNLRSPSPPALHISSTARQPSTRTQQRRNRDREDSQDNPTPTLGWTKDQGQGDYCSLDYLIEWLALGDNFKKYQHGLGGKKKLGMARECSEWMSSSGCPTRRSTEQIQNKIRELLRRWREARDWLNHTGKGLFESMVDGSEDPEKITQAEQTVKATVLKKCPEFEAVDPIFAERDGGTESLRTGTTGTSNITLETIMRDPHHPSPSAEGSPHSPRPPSPSQMSLNDFLGQQESQTEDTSTQSENTRPATRENTRPVTRERSFSDHRLAKRATGLYTSSRRGEGKNTAGGIAGLFEGIVASRKEEIGLEKRKLAIQEEEREDSKRQRKERAKNDRLVITSKEAQARLTAEQGLPVELRVTWVQAIADAEERYDRAHRDTGEGEGEGDDHTDYEWSNWSDSDR
ncbi:hypothetical protein M231_00754 [Tremella mesenterica]|uniref:Uncharacterized protein n=1 Tax=Tremella mesenterica TaxID=5217 RepID=A0A4Q1BV55_TREME|nr:hypothetical protein M231_00754 [Tremella mesenterica]